MRLRAALLSVALVGGGLAVAMPSGTAAATPPPTAQAAASDPAGTFVPVTPFRAVDTRTGAGGNRRGALVHRSAFTARVAGVHGVPKKVGAVALTITAVAPSGTGGLRVYKAGGTRPAVTNLLFRAGRTASATTVARTSTAGKVTIYNSAHKGRTHVSVDVSGYYVAGAPSDEVPGLLHTVAPKQAFGSHAIGAHRTLTANLGGRAGVPSSSVGAVAVVVTALGPQHAGGLVAYEAGAERPLAATTSFAKSTDTAGFGLVPTDGDGRIAIYNSSAGRVHVTVAVVGYTVGGVVTSAGATQVGAAHRVLGRSLVRAGHTRTVAVVGHAGVPKGKVTAVLVNVTVTGTHSGSVTAWTAGATRPHVVTVQFRSGQTASALALVRPSSKGRIEFRNGSGGGVHLAVDNLGYVAAVTAPPVGPPAASVSHYIRTLLVAPPPTDGSNAQALNQLGCDDAMASPPSTYVLLDLGAQSVTSRLTPSSPGVLLTQTSTRLSYSELTDALLGTTQHPGYLLGFADCANGRSATIAIGTNNDGAFTGQNAYAASKRGADWANFVAGLRAGSPSSLTVVGANDIESDFAGTYAQVISWEKAYLGADNTGNRVGTLIDNGSASGCPSALGVINQACGSTGWTQADYYTVAHGLFPSRIQALPQVYNSAQPRQWADIDATGGGAIRFAGSLTEHGACPSGSSPGCAGNSSVAVLAGWHALYKAVATVVAHPQIPAATDLDVDGQPVS